MPRIPNTPPRRTAPFAAVLVASAILAAEAHGQTAPASKAAAAPAGPPPVSAAYASRDKLMLYVEFDGLDAHEDAWRKTAAYRMVNDTPLGRMLEDVAAPLLERVATSLPNRKINGADAVAVVKHVARKGFVLAFHADPAVPRGARGILVLRGADSKEAKGLLSRLLVSFMHPSSKHKLERKGSHQLVVVPPPDWDGKTPDKGWSWWAEGGDFVLTLVQPSDADGALAALDGKAPNAVDFEPVASLSQADAGVTPVLKAYFDPSLRPATPDSPVGFPGDAGIQRIEYRWGFQDEALASSTRLISPKPRQGALAFLDDPAFEAKKLLPIPEGVTSFASASLKPEQWSSLLAGVLGSGPSKASYDAFVEGVRTRSRMDFEKDLLGNMGPRVVVYLAPGASSPAPAASPASLTDPMAVFSALGPALPRPVIVAEVPDPARFARSLDGVMLEANRQIKAVYAEQLADAVKADAAKANAGNRGDLPGLEADDPGADRKDRKRDEPAIPEFRLLPSTGEHARTYMLNVPTSSSVKLPSGFKPTIRLDGSFLAASTSPEAARAAADTLKRKPWTTPDDLAQAVSKAPDPAVFLFYGDFRDATAATLAALPGVLQSGINTAIAASDQILAAIPAGPGQTATAEATSAPGPGLPGLQTAGLGMAEDGGQRPAGTPGGPGSPGAPAMVQIRVDPSRLPRAEQLKSLMFPSTTTVTVDELSIRIVTRGALPDATALLGVKGFLPALLAQPIAAARKAASAAPAAAGQPAGGQPGAPRGEGLGRDR